METERWHHLELGADSNDQEEREEHRIIARFLKEFILAMKDIKVIEEQSRHPELKPNTDPNYMEFDSGTNLEPDPLGSTNLPTN